MGFVAASGHMPRSLALLHLFVIVNGIVLYTDFHHREDKEKVLPEADDSSTSDGVQPKKRVTFSFDSAGWLYVYQFGVAAWLQEHMTPGISPDNVENSNSFPKGLGFSGSSAGALTALLLASGTSVREVFEYVLGQYDVCSRNPHMMPICAEDALRRYQYPGAFRVLTGRLRILVTRLLLRPPFFMGEIVDEFADNEAAIKWLLASCHIPIVFGIWPRYVNGKAYYDGMAWSSLLVPWRGASEDRIIKVSGLGNPLTDIRPPLIPLWWSILPPSPRVLRGLYWRGYQDAALFFQAEPRRPLLDQACKACIGRRQVSDPDFVKPASPFGTFIRQISEEEEAKLARKTEDEVKKMAADLAKWKAAKALLRKPAPVPGEPLGPDMDEACGEQVSVLIEEFHDAAKRRITAAVTVTLFAAAVAALTYLPPRNATLGFVILVSVSASWLSV